MVEYIFLTNHYMPTPGATGMCIHQLAKELVLRGNHVTTIAYNDEIGCTEYDGVLIKKISVPSYFTKKIGNKKGQRCDYYRSLVSKLCHISKYPLRSNRVVSAFYQTAKQICDHTDAKITIVASFAPLEALIAGKKLKEEYGDRVRTVYYSADTLSNEKGTDGILPIKYREMCGLSWEKKLFSAYDRVIIMECHMEHYFLPIYNKYEFKYRIANFPLLSQSIMYKEKEIDESGTSLLFVYTGTLYRHLRNPLYICSMLMALGDEICSSAIFMGKGDCSELMSEFEEESQGNIRYLGMQPHETVLQYLSSADVLLSIGNAESPMAPSKIYEYMATGKPIIHTYTYDKDPCLEPLRRYGNALMIKENDQNGKQKALEFIRKKKRLKFDEVKELFITSTPEYTVDIINEVW